MQTIRFKASPTAVEALQLDDPGRGARRVRDDDRYETGTSETPPDLYEASLEDARLIMADADARANGGGWGGESDWRYVRPCRAVARRIKEAIGAVAKC